MSYLVLRFTEDEWSELHESICEGRRQDALDILNREAAGQSFCEDANGHPLSSRMRSIDEQRRLFPDRIP